MDFTIFVKPTYPLRGHKTWPSPWVFRIWHGKGIWAHAWLGSPSHWPLFHRTPTASGFTFHIGWS
jgi:hypothetical protein